MNAASGGNLPCAAASLANLAARPTQVRPWVAELRAAGAKQFDQIGLPTRRDEAWRHTDIRPLRDTDFAPAEADAATAERLHTAYQLTDAVAELVFVNGVFDAGLSRMVDLPEGVLITTLADAFSHESDSLSGKLGSAADAKLTPFVALNQAALADGAAIDVAAGTEVAQPIHLLFISTPGSRPTASFPRTFIHVGDRAKATFVESYVGPEDSVYLTNAVTEVVAGDAVDIDHVKLNQESMKAFHVAAMEVSLGTEANWTSHSGTLGGRLTRNDLNVTLGGEQSHATLNGLVVGQVADHTDNHTLLRHHEPNCTSYQLYKHVMDRRSTGVFKGQIYVAQKAQKTDAVQNSRSLLLSDDAQMNSQPALEIYADDVKCTHGSTTGPLDEGGLFYLNTRGVDAETARRLLTYAFAADVTRRIKVEPVRARIEDFLAKQHGLPTDFRIQDLAGATEDVVF